MNKKKSGKLTTIKITDEQRKAVDHYYPSLQMLMNEVFTMVLKRYQKEQNEEVKD